MIDKNQEGNQVITVSLLILAIIAVAFTLFFTKPIMIPFVLALFVRILIDPIIDFQMIYLRIHRIVAVIVSIILIVCLFMIIIPFIAGSVATFLESANEYNTKVLLLLDLAINKLQEFDININKEIIRNSFLSLPFLDWASAILSNGANFITKFFLVIIITMFLLLGSKTQETSETWKSINKNVKTYVFTKFITSSFTGIITGLIYWFLGLELALIFGTLTFLLNFIPVFGSIIAVILPLPVAFLQFSDPTYIIFVILFPGIVHIIIGNILEPKLFGEAFGLHPVTIILSLIFWGMIWGIIGILLAAPITAVIKISFEKFETTLPIAKFLAGKIHHKN